MKQEKDDFRSEFDSELRKSDYVARRVIPRGILWFIIIFVVLCVLGFGYKVFRANTDYEVFKSSKMYNEAASTFLADSYKEYNDAEIEADKQAVMEYVILRYPNLDTDEIESSTLVQFYNLCLEN